MNYNVLAQDLVFQHPHLYTKNSKHALKWQTRWKNLFKEITDHDCDVNRKYLFRSCLFANHF